MYETSLDICNDLRITIMQHYHFPTVIKYVYYNESAPGLNIRISDFNQILV